jgi:predicted heme/steroid binding protein
MNTLLIEKQTGGYFKFTLNGDTANAITSINNDLLAVGNQLHFKTGNGANIIKEQFIYAEDVTIISGGTFTFTTVAQVWDKLIAIDYFAWLGGGGTGGVDRFDDLLDTFSYTGNAGKAVVVDNSELKLVPITLYNKRLFTELEDTPSSLVPNKMLVVNPAGTAVVLQDQPEAPEVLLNSVGYFDYEDLITQTVPLTATNGVAKKLTNDTEGLNTNIDQNPYGVSFVWDFVDNQFNFSELTIGDTIDIRIHIRVTTTTSNQKVEIKSRFGIGSASQFDTVIYDNVFKSPGVHEISFVAPFYMGSLDIINNPAELYLTTDANATIRVYGWYVRILRKNINLITVDYTVPDATTTVKGIVRLAGDLAGTSTNPTVPALADKALKSTTININGNEFDLSANRAWSIPTHNAVSIGSANGLSITSDGQVLSLALASAGSIGALSANDWMTFNSKIGGSGTTNYLSKFTASGTIGNSQIFDNGTNVGIGTESPTSRLTVNVGAGEMEGLNLRDGSNATSAFVYSSVTGENRIGGIVSYAFPTFYSGGSERMRITSNGNVGIGTTNPSTRLDVNGAITASGGFFNSDIRLKDLIDYDYNVLDIKPISYLWKDGRDEKKHVGYSAQDVQKVMPDAVNEDEDGMLSVNYIEVLVAKIAELENRIKQFEK